MNIDHYIASARHAMRLTSCLERFARLATGEEGRPVRPVILDKNLLGHDRDCLAYAEVRARYAGIFNQHFVASLPYVLEEQCRLGAALLQYSKWLAHRGENIVKYYTLGDGPGVTSRTLSDISGGRIHTLTCSPNIENFWAFSALCPASAHFFHGPFFDVSPMSLADAGLHDLADGFDVIVEDTSFQMYGRERAEPIQIAARNLKQNGIFVLLEKFAHEDPAEFARRERQKDEEFKLRFFERQQIDVKRATIVNNMDAMLVTLANMRDALSTAFRHAVIVWNSGNFCTIAAGNDMQALQHLVSFMIPPAIPPDFQYLNLPLVLLGEPSPAFRNPLPA